jgi:hypothetical protein
MTAIDVARQALPRTPSLPEPPEPPTPAMTPDVHDFDPGPTFDTQCLACWGWYDDPRHFTLIAHGSSA